MYYSNQKYSIPANFISFLAANIAKFSDIGKL